MTMTVRRETAWKSARFLKNSAPIESKRTGVEGDKKNRMWKKRPVATACWSLDFQSIDFGLYVFSLPRPDGPARSVGLDMRVHPLTNGNHSEPINQFAIWTGKGEMDGEDCAARLYKFMDGQKEKKEKGFAYLFRWLLTDGFVDRKDLAWGFCPGSPFPFLWYSSLPWKTGPNWA